MLTSIPKIHHFQANILNSYKNEVEEKSYRDINGNLFRRYFYTDRAFLAQHKLLLEETLGQGRYSKVKKAYDLNWSRQIAIKIIDRDKAPKDFKETFLLRELENWPKLKHQNIIKMFYYIFNQNKIYMILEYVDHGNMLSYMKKINGPLPENESRICMKQICCAVKYLHLKNVSQGLMGRLKSTNIFIILYILVLSCYRSFTGI